MHREKDRRTFGLSCVWIATALVWCDFASASRLLVAISKNDTEKTLSLIEAGADVNEPDKGTGYLPLDLAAARGNVVIVSALLAGGAKVNGKHARWATTPLFSAIECIEVGNTGCEEVVSLLLDRGADPKTEASDGRTPLIRAAGAGSAKVVKLLIDHGADPNYNTNINVTALMAASIKGSSDVVTLLLESGAKVDGVDSHGNTPLMLAAFGGHGEIVSVLIAQGAKIDKRNSSQETPLILASAKGQAAVVEALITAGADVHAVTREGRNALHLASIGDNVGIGKQLIAQGATPTIIELGEEDYFGTGRSHATFAECLELDPDRGDPNNYYKLAAEYFDRAASAYRDFEKSYGKDVRATRAKNILSILFANIAAYGGATANAMQSPTGAGYGVAFYTTSQTGSLVEVREHYRERAAQAATLASTYRQKILKSP